MGIYLKQWALVQETSAYSLRRVSADTFTREQAERLARLWSDTWPDKAPLIVINLRTE
jgi:hypothetical protein